MKTRNGFVSNSSSSSFIVAFNKIPKNANEMRVLLFGEDQECVAAYDRGITTVKAAKIVFKDLQEEIKAKKQLKSKEEFLEEIQSGYFEGYPDYNYSTSNSANIYREFCSVNKDPKKNIYDDPKYGPKYKQATHEEHEKHRAQVEQSAELLLNRYWHNFKDRKCFVFSYSDNDGEVGSIMEHGDIFHNLPHMRISHH